jgi:hypothetical protein
MTVLHDTEVDGVRCFWVETGRPTLAALLKFRYGIADEPLHESGWTHMLEHMALEGRGGGSLNINGSVSLIECQFDAHGPVEAVADHLSALTTWLSDPLMPTLDRERRVLRAENQYRGATTASRALGWRFGAHGPGLVSYDEPGLSRATAERLRERASSVFTRGNAVLVLDGPPPPGLTISLPEGELLPARPAEPCKDRLPAAYNEGQGLAMSGLVPRSHAASLAGEVLQRQLTDELRHGEGAAYAPWATYERVDRDTAVLIAGSDIQEQLLESIVGRALRMARGLAGTGPNADKLRDIRENRLQQMRDPYAALGIAVYAASNYFDGREPVSYEAAMEEVATVDVEGVHEVMGAFGRTLLLGVPDGAAWSDQLPVLNFPVESPRISGTSYRHADWPAVTERIVIGDAGIELGNRHTARAIDLADIEALFLYDNGLRHAVRLDGYGVTVDPRVWANGERAAGHLERLVPPEKHLIIPAQGPLPPIARLGSVARWWGGVRRLAGSIVGDVLLVLVFAAVVVVAFTNGLALVAVVFGGFAVLRAVRDSRSARSESG